MERDDRRDELAAPAGVDRGADDRAVAEMHTVERPDRDRARAHGELAGRAGDVHAALLRSARPCASTPARIVSGTRSSASCGRRASASLTGRSTASVDVRRLLDAERPDRGPAQRRAVPAERLGDRPDVGARADVQRQPHALARIRDHVERVHERTPHGHLDDDAPARELVRPLAADLHRRRRGDRQLHLTAEALERFLERRPAAELRAARPARLRDRPSTSSRSGRHR